MVLDIQSTEKKKMQAVDGPLGTVETVYFDDEKWVIRYLVAKRGFWIFSHRLLVSPISVTHHISEEGEIAVNVTKEEAEKAPKTESRQPISRRKEEQFFRYHRMPVYWGGAGLWGGSMTPMEAGTVSYRPSVETEPDASGVEDEYHLRSTSEVEGYEVRTSDEKIGTVASFLVEDSTWAVRYIRIAADPKIGGGALYVSPHWVDEISWLEATMTLDLPTSRLTELPTIGVKGALTREDEETLHSFFQQPRYWK